MNRKHFLILVILVLVVGGTGLVLWQRNASSWEASGARIGQKLLPKFDIDAVAAGLVDKLVRRHPHVFADVEASTPEEVAANWQRIKEQEREAKRARDGRLD